MNNFFSRALRGASLLGLTLLVTACATDFTNRITIESSIPEPIFEKLPLVAGVVYGNKMSNFESIEKPQNGKEWEIRFGDSHRRIFDTLLGGLFTHVVVLPDTSSAAESPHKINTIFVPDVADFSLLTASDSGGKFFAVSMKHIIDVYNPAGEKVDRLELNSYGRERSKFDMSSGNNQVNSAVNDAFRDLAVSAFVAIPKSLASAGLVKLAKKPSEDGDE